MRLSALEDFRTAIDGMRLIYPRVSATAISRTPGDCYDRRRSFFVENTPGCSQKSRQAPPPDSGGASVTRLVDAIDLRRNRSDLGDAYAVEQRISCRCENILEEGLSDVQIT